MARRVRWWWGGLALAALVGVAVTLRMAPRVPAPQSRSGPVQPAVDDPRRWLAAAFQLRARALLTGDADSLAPLYDLNTESGRAAWEHQQGRIRYVRDWASRRGVTLAESRAEVRILSLTVEGGVAKARLVQRAGFAYRYRQPEAVHRFGIGTRHQLELVRTASGWKIRRDEYTDPLEEDTLVRDVSPACGPLLLDPQASLAAAVGASWPPGAYRRRAAVAYADRYCGAAWGCGNGGRYNPRYPDFNDQGGDCTNFVSQVLGDPRAGALPQTAEWRYDPAARQPSVAWVQTDAFARFLASRARLLAKGTYEEVRRPQPGQPGGPLGALRPGDVIGYEEQGNLVHFAVVTGRDPAGVPVVNSHTADRYRVPWDLGWDRRTIFWLFALPDGPSA